MTGERSCMSLVLVTRFWLCVHWSPGAVQQGSSSVSPALMTDMVGKASAEDEEDENAAEPVDVHTCCFFDDAEKRVLLLPDTFEEKHKIEISDGVAKQRQVGLLW